MRVILIAVEVGLSTLCLLAGGLLMRSFVNLFEADRGFAVTRLVTVNLNLPGTRYPGVAERARFMRTLLDSAQRIPGVVSAGISNMLPLNGEGANNLLSLEGTAVLMAERPLADTRGVNGDYFRTMGIPLREGRIFAESDGEHKLAVVSASTAERLWPGQNPLGKRFQIGDGEGPFVEVAGVVGDVRSVGLDRAPGLTVYVPYWQRRTWGGPSLAVKTAGEPVALTASIRGAIRGIDSELPIPRFETMEEVVDESVAQRRFQMELVLLFGATALLLAALGIYGVISYSVALRTNEMGIRMALGAQGSSIVKMILRQAMTPVAIGISAGLVTFLAAGRLLAALLFGVTPTDSATMAGVVLVLVVVAASASVVPARRASRVDPLVALRYE